MPNLITGETLNLKLVDQIIPRNKHVIHYISQQYIEQLIDSEKFKVLVFKASSSCAMVKVLSTP